MIEDPVNVLFIQAMQCQQQGDLDSACKLCNQILELDHEFKDAWHLLGTIALFANQFETAITCFKMTLKIDPKYYKSYYNLAYAHSKLADMAQAEACFRMVSLLNPTFADAYSGIGLTQLFTNQQKEAGTSFFKAFDLGADKARTWSNLGLVYLELNLLDQAEMFCRNALNIEPNNPNPQSHLALILMKKGELEEGFKLYESRKQLPELGLDQNPFKQPYWNGEDLTDKSILVFTEQGCGDTFQFCRYIPLIKAKQVIILAPKELKKVLQTLSDNILVLGDDDPDNAIPEFDYKCAMMSLPGIFKTTINNIPNSVYLKAEKSNLLNNDKLKVGLVWAGLSRSNDPHAVAIDKRRSMKLAELDGLLSLGEIDFISLQLGLPAKQLRLYPQIKDMTPYLKDWSDTASLIQELDLIVSVDTAVVHLAGALGKPVYLLDRFDSCWRWFTNRPDSPWYSTLKIFRQEKPDDWNHPVFKVKQALVRTTKC